MPLIAVFVVAAIMALSNRPGRTANGLPLIESDSQYNDALELVRKTSRPAVEKFNTGVELDPADRDESLKNARIFDSMDAYRPEMEAGYYTAGLMYYLAGDSDTSEARLTQALMDSTLPGNLKTFDDTSKVEKVTADCHHMLSLIAFDRHDYQKAIEEANAAIKHHAGTEGVLDGTEGYYFAKAQAEVQLKLIAKAKADLKESLKFNPDYSPAIRLAKFLGL